MYPEVVKIKSLNKYKFIISCWLLLVIAGITRMSDFSGQIIVIITCQWGP